MLFTLKLYQKNLEDVFTSAILNKWELYSVQIITDGFAVKEGSQCTHAGQDMHTLFQASSPNFGVV